MTIAAHNPIEMSSTAFEIDTAAALIAAAERIQRSTVQVRGEGPGGGSGVIWSGDGIVVTNAHVARGDRATVELSDGRTFDAVVTARDPRRDLAALKIEASGLPALDAADSNNLQVGQLVLAVGNPLGMVGAMTAGVVHAIGVADEEATLPGQDLPSGVSRRQDWVQADVQLAPGNSGGPLTDAAGRVIGINSMISGGLALAVPSNEVQTFLRRSGDRPRLGVVTQPVAVHTSNGRLPGLVVLETEAGSPADVAGIITGDVLIGAGGTPFRGPDALLDALAGARGHDTLVLQILRGGTPRDIDVTFAGRVPVDAAA